MNDRGAGSTLAGRDRRDALRLAVTCGTIALLAVAASGILAWSAVRNGWERTLSERQDRIDDRIVSAMGDRQRRVDDALAGVERRLRDAGSDPLGRLLAGGQSATDFAKGLVGEGPIDDLVVSDERGRTLSAWPWSARIGLPADSLGFPADRAVLSTRLTIDGGGPAFVRRREVEIGGRRISLVATSFLDEPLLRTIAEDGVALLLDGTGRSVVRVGAPDGPSWQEIADCASGASGESWVPGGDRLTWRVRSHPFRDDEGRPVATIAVGVSSRELQRLLDRVRIGFVALAAVAAMSGALAGAWVARGLARPLRGLVRAVDAVAAGEADYDFRLERGFDGAGELAASFTRLHRSLELQRQRSAASERVAAWRDAARQVAHEVKNPLVPIRLTAQNLQRAKRTAPEKFDAMFRDGMTVILEEVDQLSRLVGEFSEYARLPSPTPRTCDVEQLVDSVVDLVRAEPGVEVERRRAGSLPPLKVDPDQISRALKNVLGNAIDAMRAGRAGGSPMRLEVSTGIDAGAATIEIADRGPGLSEEEARRVFEPGFTTKPTGSGLGLAITQRIVVEHGGVITADRREGGGTKFVIRLPLPG